MQFAHSDDLAAFRESTRGFLDAEHPPERLREDAPQDLWPQLVEMGLVDVASVLSVSDLVPLLEETGRAALIEPLAETAGVAVPLLGELGAADAVPAGARVAVCHPLNPYVNQADRTDHVLMISEDQTRLCASGELSLEPVRSIDPWRTLFKVTATGGSVIADGPREGAHACQHAANLGALAASAELLGLAERMIELSTAYTQTREQFGKPIATFQAVKHLLANAQIKLEFARPVVHRASVALDQPVAIAHAKVAATDAALFAAEQAIQVHGGMGYTYEADLHFYMKRAWALAGIWGGREHHLQVVDQAVLEGGIAVGPQFSFDQSTRK